MSTYFRYDGICLDGSGHPVAGVNVAVLTQPANTTTQPGSPLATIYADSTGTALSNPTTSDGLGNFFFYAAAGIYTVQLYGSTLVAQVVRPDQNVVAGGGSGSVTSVALTMPSEFSVSGSPVSSSGTLAVSKANQNANIVYAGPSSGSAAAPAFRALVAADFPGGVGTVTSTALTVAVPAFLTQSVSGSPVTTSGTLAITLGTATQTANTGLFGPTSGAASNPTFRALVPADIPVSVNTLSGSTDAVTFTVYRQDFFVTTAGIDAMTLATPVATTDDGKRIRVFDAGGHAHTITAAANKIVPSHHLITFGGTAGSWVELEAYQGLWYPVSNSGVTIS